LTTPENTFTLHWFIHGPHPLVKRYLISLASDIRRRVTKMSKHTHALLVGTALLLLAPAFAGRATPNAAAPADPQRHAPCQESPAEYRDICDWLGARYSAGGGNREVRLLNGETVAAANWRIASVRSHAVFLDKESPRDAALLIQYRDIRMLESDGSGKTIIHLRRDRDRAQ
jgi:hypothetical protein